MPDSQTTTAAPRVLRLSPKDNVGVVTGTVAAGQTLPYEDATLTITDAITLGHKVALCAIKAGEKIFKYGAPIGSAKVDLAPGQHVHTHNMKSDYLPTYTYDGTNPFHKGE